MTIYDSIYALAKKMAKSLQKGERIQDLEESTLFREEDKIRIQENLTEESIQRQISTLKDIDIEKSWEQVASQLSHQKKSANAIINKVAAIVVVCISVASFTLYFTSKKAPIKSERISIAAGTDEATLTLGDRSQVVLEEKSQYKNEIASTNGERLVYSGTTSNLQTEFNFLTVPKGGQYQVALIDGTEIWLNADTKIKYPIVFKPGEPRIVELLYGEAYFNVSPSTKHQGDAFKVVSKDQEVQVVGTEFNIKAYNDEDYIYTTLVEGQVQIAVDGKLEPLYPNEQFIIDRNTKQIIKTKVDVTLHTAWIRGYFNFKNKPLKDIMKVLSRWYDVEIIFTSKALEDVKFSGVLSKKQNITDILNGIQNTNSLNAYEIKNKTITIK